MPHTATSQFGQQLNSPPFISRRLPRSRVRCPPPIRVRPPPPLRFHLKRLVVHFGLLFVLISQATGQFGEIASVISSLVANGAPAGLAGLGTAGSLGSLGSLGASAGSGAAGALSNFGPLYQLAQAALQLTGTGVGIANQASESAWFPVVVENAAKMHRDFQDRLVQGGGGGGGGAAVAGSAGGTATAGPKDRSGSKSGGGEFGTDYGKEFGSEEKGGGVGNGGGGVGNGGGAVGRVDPPGGDIFGSRGSLLPLLPGFGVTSATLLPEGAKRPKLPVPGSLLPGESPLGEFNGKENEEFKSGKKLIGIGSVEEVPLSPPSTEPNENFGKGIASPEASLGQFLPGEVVPTKSRPMTNIAKPSDISPSAISSPKITVQLPDYDEEKDLAKSRGEMETKQQKKKKTKVTENIETGFSTDNNGAEEEARGGGEGGTEESRLEPLTSSDHYLSILSAGYDLVAQNGKRRRIEGES
uniref:Glycine-rich cell wall structural protein 1 n=1 Tax=Globodera pallida TaxID=36090 RepID=A0A183CHS5_GLOPA